MDEEELAFNTLEKSDEMLAVLAGCSDVEAFAALINVTVQMCIRPTKRSSDQPFDLAFKLEATGRLTSLLIRLAQAADAAIEQVAVEGRVEYMRRLEQHRAPLYRARRAPGA